MRAIKYLIRLANLLSVSDGSSFRTGKATALGKDGNAFLLTPYGLDHNPPPGSTVLLVQIGGDEGNKVGIAGFPQSRPKGLKSGEVIVSNYLTGSKVFFKEDGSIDIDTPNKLTITAASDIFITSQSSVTVTAPTVTVNSDNVSLGGEGGPAVARVGDLVAISSGSSAGNWPIVSGSAKVSAV